ncbi:AAA family ATPase [Paenibacillus ginsengarvi]|uniref:ATP-binding protein n=1 Tax=Paenibacillus ginsengarvi TaxID=400777 RepID=A0A3B0CIR1_9BACL|nr:AAA family ATPase [Paenibacillus ginsengarvi]RKN84890.1 ATP-binding protein [Paenibacillus ginsengarvi]
MKRYVIVTVGKTHSGKTTFAQALQKRLDHSAVIDQDNHAEFVNAHYKTLLPVQGPNTLKFAITRTIVDYAVSQTNDHLILCNSNRARKGRTELLERFRHDGFASFLVYFDLPDSVLQARIAESRRSTAIFRTASTFGEVLLRQQADSARGDATAPDESEADHFFVIESADNVQSVIQNIVDIVGECRR